MASHVRALIMAVLIAAFVWYTPAVSTPLAHAVLSVADRFDSRPERAILFIGNSRTFYHDMPYMVRKVADSAHAPERYRIVVHAPGGATLEDHWNDPSVHALLKQKWRNVVIQAQSSEQVGQAEDDSFHRYGAKLINEARGGGSIPLLYVTWRYSDDFEYYTYRPELRSSYYGIMQQSHQWLADDTGARMVNVGKAWEMLLAERPAFSLYEDGNHPTVQGSYLAALMFYGHFCGRDCGEVSWVPAGVSDKDATLIKNVVRRYYGQGS
ncbi:MAG TPA: DUF4886 domain-containing protein [Xanthobacteraceae bacterium]|jgi:hypothetical protein